MLQQVPTRAFHVMAKPSGSDCNLNCDYCFYLEKQSLYREKPVTIWTMTRWKRMSVTISLPANPKRSGFLPGRAAEPTLLGLDFYRRAVALQAKYGAGRKISNSFQTNGVSA
ncbi:arylsulfatase [Escherichia coli]|uniref:Arylsulfatase n=1 Tax=Escherichia coli TaxID=562 RepID=A0A376MM26_ECOLX|nr:arylsulfatase [Escherichia coli]